jgi:hypothetical protein
MEEFNIFAIHVLDDTKEVNINSILTRPRKKVNLSYIIFPKISGFISAWSRIAGGFNKILPNIFKFDNSNRIKSVKASYKLIGNIILNQCIEGI